MLIIGNLKSYCYLYNDPNSKEMNTFHNIRSISILFSTGLSPVAFERVEYYQ
jgi:hypothetical protein